MTAFSLFSRKPKPGYPEAVARLKEMTRTLLRLSEDESVSISESTCRDPGCPDIETVIAIFSEGRAPRVYRFHKAIIDVDDSEFSDALIQSP
jgi:hypothetical protein